MIIAERIKIDVSEDRYSQKTRAVYEGDTGHTIEIAGAITEEEYTDYTAEFSRSLMHGDAKGYPMQVESDKLVVKIPDELLNTNEDHNRILFVFITGKDEKSGKTIAMIKIPVFARPRNVE